MTFIDEVKDVNLESVVKNAKNQDNPELAVFSFGPQPGEKAWTERQQDTATIKIMEDALVSTAHLLQQMSKQIVSPVDTPIHKLLRKVDNALNYAQKG